MTDLFAGVTIPLDAQIAEVERELALRARVYPRLISTGKMQPNAADIHTENLKAALATLQLVKQHDLLRLIPQEDPKHGD